VQQARINVVPRCNRTQAPASCLSATIRSFSARPQRRRRSLPPIISTTSFDIALSSTSQGALRSTASAYQPRSKQGGADQTLTP
jgi:hypothetical protein